MAPPARCAWTCPRPRSTRYPPGTPPAGLPRALCLYLPKVSVYQVPRDPPCATPPARCAWTCPRSRSTRYRGTPPAGPPPRGVPGPAQGLGLPGTAGPPLRDPPGPSLRDPPRAVCLDLPKVSVYQVPRDPPAGSPPPARCAWTCPRPRSTRDPPGTPPARCAWTCPRSRSTRYRGTPLRDPPPPRGAPGPAQGLGLPGTPPGPPPRGVPGPAQGLGLPGTAGPPCGIPPPRAVRLDLPKASVYPGPPRDPPRAVCLDLPKVSVYQVPRDPPAGSPPPARCAWTCPRPRSTRDPPGTPPARCAWTCPRSRSTRYPLVPNLLPAPPFSRSVSVELLKAPVPRRYSLVP
uniref:Uncharacterized protein n=1 Tax=Pelodiscus sinensis TaxID=13735 RepID=K7F084_PELSI